GALPGSDREAGAQSIVRGHDDRDHAPHRSDGRVRAARLPPRKPVPQYRALRKRQARSLHEEDFQIDQVHHFGTSLAFDAVRLPLVKGESMAITSASIRRALVVVLFLGAAALATTTCGSTSP